MNGKIITYMIGGIGLLIGVMGSAFGLDQQKKRESDATKYCDRLQVLEANLTTKEEQLADLQSRLGEKNDQVRALVVEIQRLRDDIANMKRSA
jgi:capsule polysaccharide export protein KpsE/RkpR